MFARIRSFSFCACLLSAMLLPWQAQAQVFPRGNGISLMGVNQSDLYVEVASWVQMPGDPGEFRSEVRNRLEQKLAGAGISRRSAHRNYVVCSIQALNSGSQVAYTSAVELWNLRSTDVHTLLWKKAGIATVSQEKFDAELVASECATRFIEEWSRWNQS